MNNKTTEFQSDRKNNAESTSSAEANSVSGISHNGKACRLIDNTRSISQPQLKQLLDDLIAQKAFGIKGLSGASNTITLGKPQATHIQLGDNLYRLVLFPYEARIEKF